MQQHPEYLRAFKGRARHKEINLDYWVCVVHQKALAGMVCPVKDCQKLWFVRKSELKKMYMEGKFIFNGNEVQFDVERNTIILGEKTIHLVIR